MSYYPDFVVMPVYNNPRKERRAAANLQHWNDQYFHIYGRDLEAYESTSIVSSSFVSPDSTASNNGTSC